MKTRKLPRGLDTAAKAKCEELGVTIKETKQAEYMRGETVVIDNLITVNLPDGTSLTVSADDKDHVAKIERTVERINSDIMQGKRTRA